MTVLVLLAFFGCQDDKDSQDTTITTWECNEEHDNWERCTDENTIEWCHYMEDSPHFHEGTDCAEDGFSCVEYAEGMAACTDGSTCEGTESYCQDNQVWFCAEGYLAIESCSSIETCVVQDGVAFCQEQGGSVEDKACSLMQSEADESEVVTDFDSVFSEDYHMEQGVAVTVTLPKEVSYIHFPVEFTSEYGIFASEKGAIQAILDKTEQDTGAHEHGGNSQCEDLLPVFWHADLTNDTDGKIPFVIQLAPLEKQVTLIVLNME